MAPGNPNYTDALPGGFDPRAAGRILLYIAIITFCAAALASIAVILFGDFGGTEGKILLSSFSIAAYSLAGLIATARYGREPRWMAVAGLVSAGSGLVLTLMLIWTEAEYDGLIRIALSMMLITGALAHANLLRGPVAQEDPAAGILMGTLGVNALLTALIVIPILAEADPGGGYWKLVAILAVLLVLGTLVVPIVRKIKDVGSPNVSEAPYSSPVPFVYDGAMEIRYQGRTFQVELIPMEEQPGYIPRAWLVTGQGRQPVTLDGDTPPASDAPTALSAAVREIARAVDSSQI